MAKKSKILLAFLLVLVMVMTTACTVSEEIKEPADVSSDSSADASSSTEPSGSDSQEQAEITIAEAVLYEADGVKVTATGYEDGWMGPAVKVLVENDSSQNVLVTARSVSVNGYMMPFASLYAQVAAEKKANESLSIMTSELERAGIETIADLQFYINVSDADSWEDLDTSELITLHTSAAGLEQPVDDSGDVLYDDKGIRIVCKGLKQDIIWDGSIVFFMENHSGQPITVYAENVSVNGFMQDAGLWSSLREDTRLIDSMSLLDLSDLELASIDEVENIEFNLRIINADTWDEVETTDVISLDFH